MSYKMFITINNSLSDEAKIQYNLDSSDDELLVNRSIFQQSNFKYHFTLYQCPQK